MTKNQLSFFLLLFPVLLSGQPAEMKSAVLKTIALGSCNRQNLPQVMWNYIGQNDPDLWVWLGDNIYGDSEDTAVLATKYRQVKNAPEYQAFIRRTPVIGTWDDHDYGANNAGKEYPGRVESKELMLDFLDVPRDAAVRRREGAYQSCSYGPEGRRMKVILLDCRYFRDSLRPGPEKNYLPNETGDILGEAQWQWLERELRDATVQLFLVCSGFQILPDEHRFEKWANFPKARGRLLSMISRVGTGRVLLVSGDRHFAELSKMTLEGMPYPLYEFTSSGMTHSRPELGEPNRFRVGPLIEKRNFGVLRIDWSGARPCVRTEIRGLDNELFASEELRW